MGASISAGQDNDDLVNNLIKSGYIRSEKVEKVFRAVDRADYVLSTHRERAYKDLAWKHGNIHLSAPCVYSEVMEGLSLEPGLSFLNIGSGTGYISTMAGLILTQHGTNHGIELHEDCVKYAYDRLEEFKQNSQALDKFDFCEPVFVQGNCLSVVSGRQYDRVYCGAACPQSHEAFVKQFVRVGGILVMPFRDHLLRLERVEENTWTQKSLLPVSFTTLVVPAASEQNLINLPECEPLSLQELCRGKIRRRLRQNVWREHPELETTKPLVRRRQQTERPAYSLGRLVIPILDEFPEMDSDDEEVSNNASLLLSMDTHSGPGDRITTTLQFVQAVIPPNPANGNQEERSGRNDNSNRERYMNEVPYPPDDDVISPCGIPTPPSEDETDFETISPELLDELFNTRNETNSRDTTERQSQIEKRNGLNVEGFSNQKSEEQNTGESSRSNSEDIQMSDNSDMEHESDYTRHKKDGEQEKSDSGIVEDSNLFEGSTSSNADQSNTEAVNAADSSDPMDIDLNDVTPNKSFINTYNSSHSGSSGASSRKKTLVGHYIDGEAFTSYMKEKIHQLPLPFSLKLYINYNRKL